ncbi:hypothetical protein HA48_05635 [Pantoea wallisii]|uniref:Peptidylprolyl isomerase n=1 Tax=Pantoea wallisii TaxID=1076551 RepID=A0A1X1DCI0_9GAMM|nr:hypothetical protein [Pantoea wallisii]ORM74201.1 hypothetical protein HA48_05635 [Pantoea wallisii]
MTERRLLAVLMTAALFMPGVASSASDTDMLRAFGDAARTLPPAPVVSVPPKPKAKPAPKPAAAPDYQVEVKRLQARIQQLEKQPAAVPTVNPDEALKKQLAAREKQIATLNAQQQQQESQISKLTAALTAAQQQQNADRVEVKKQLDAAKTAAQRHDEAMKNQQAESDKNRAAFKVENEKKLTAELAANDKKLAALQAESQQKLTEQQAVSDKKLAALQAESQQKLTEQQAVSDKKLAALQAESQQKLTEQQAVSDKKLAALQTESQQKLTEQQAAGDKKLAALQSQQQESLKQLAELNAGKQQQAITIASLTADLAAAQKRPAAAAEPAEPKSDAERDGYTLGQFIASNAVVQLQMVKDIGLKISMDQLIAGLTTQLKTGDSALAGEEMARRYAAMQQSISKGLNTLVAKGYAQLDKQVAKRKVLQAGQGMRWFAVKPVKTKLIPDQQVAVTVKVSTLGGKVINDFADDTVPFNNSLPPLLHEGMALTGRGGAIEGWALAKDIYEREPLPPWVTPYDIIHYELAIK